MTGLPTILSEIVDFAIAIAGADFGNIQLLDPDTGDLLICGQRGFPDWWVQYWNEAGKGAGSCGVALVCGERVIVEDVERSPIFVGTPGLDVQRRVGVRACQSTPVVSRSGTPIGMFSTHYRKPCRPSPETLRLLDVLARQAAEIIERTRAEEALAAANRQLQEEIGQRVRMSAALHESEQRIKTLTAATHEGIAITSEGRFLDINDQLARMLGWSRDELIGMPVQEIVAPEDRERVKANVEAGLDSFIEHQAVRKDGSRIVVEAHGKTVDSNRGQIRLTAVRDVTQDRKIHDELLDAKRLAEEANASKSRFLAAVSHDLRQPLAALSLYVGGLEETQFPGRSALIGNMRNCVRHLSDMLSALLDVSRLEAGAVTPNKRNFDLDELLVQINATHQPKAQAKGLALRVATFGKTGCTDPALFQRILTNLVANAIRYTERGGVLVGTRRRHGSTWVEVWDTGIGIAPEQTAKIFEPGNLSYR